MDEYKNLTTAKDLTYALNKLPEELIQGLDNNNRDYVLSVIREQYKKKLIKDNSVIVGKFSNYELDNLILIIRYLGG